MTLNLPFFRQLAKALAKQFGDNCEVVLHDLTSTDIEHSVVLVENGHVTHRAVGDGPSHVVLEAMKAMGARGSAPTDHLAYLTKTGDGRILKSSTIYIHDDTEQKITGILSINYDITSMLLAEQALKSLVANEDDKKEPESIPQNVNDLLEDLIRQSVTLVGKPVAMMTKDDKVRAIQFLNDAGAFLITKSGDKISNFFGISKYTLYSYIDVNNKKDGFHRPFIILSFTLKLMYFHLRMKPLSFHHCTVCRNFFRFPKEFRSISQMHQYIDFLSVLL